MDVCAFIRNRCRPCNPSIYSVMPYLRHIIASVLLAVISMQALAEPQVYRRKTTAKNLRPAELPASSNAAAVPDTIPLDTLEARGLAGAIRLSGYDKPLRSPRESLFVTNRTPYDIDGLLISLTYFDSADRELHSRSVTVRCDLPAGVTRKIDFRSWDLQQSFYYKLSPKPRRDGATPYDVKCRVTAIIIPSTSDRTSHD